MGKGDEVGLRGKLLSHPNMGWKSTLLEDVASEVYPGAASINAPHRRRSSDAAVKWGSSSASSEKPPAAPGATSRWKLAGAASGSF